MKQFLTVKLNEDINSQLLCEILSQRFPSFKVYSYNGKVRVRKNAMVTVSICVNHKDEHTIVSMETLMPWWVWLFIGWLPYLVVKRGFVDEVYSTLFHALHIEFPNCVLLVSSQTMIEWRKKTKPLCVLSTFLLAYILCFCYFMQALLVVLINTVFGSNIEYGQDGHEHILTIHNIFYFTSFIHSVLWLLTGAFLIRLGKNTIKYAGYIIILYGLYLLFIDINQILWLCDIRQNMPSYYVHVNNMILCLLPLCAGYFINKNCYNGALRYVAIALIMLALSGFALYVTKMVIFDLSSIAAYDFGKYQAIEWGTNIVVFPFCYIAYILLYRAFHKLPKYPI